MKTHGQGVTELERITSEKGDLSAPAATWPQRSLFNMIDRTLRPGAQARPFGPPYAALVCDDLGTEIADFIGIDEAKDSGVPRATFIVGKHKSGNAGVSAAALYDVCGQAAKNLPYLKGDTRALPGAPRKWDGDWVLNGGRVARIRAGGGAAAIRSMFGRVRADPNARSSVWMFLSGGMLSRRALERELRRRDVAPHVLQFVHLVLSVYAACQSIGVDFRIFCAG
jgi:hypothetical protein